MKKIQAIIVFLLGATEVFPQATLADSTSKRLKLDSATQLVQQHKGDSTEIKTLIWLAQATEGNGTQQSFQYLKDALQLSLKLEAVKNIVSVYSEMGAQYHTGGQYDSSVFFYRKALRLCNKKASQCSEIYQGLAVSLLWLTQHDSAKYYLAEAETIAKANKDFKDLTGIYNSQGNIFLQENNYEQALTRYILAAKIQDSLSHDPVAKSRALANIGNVQYLIGDYDKALTYAREAQSISQKYNLQKNLAYISQLIGRIYRKQKILDEALVEYKKALESYHKLGFVREASETYSNIGNIYFDKADFMMAQSQYKKAISISKKSANYQLLGGVYAAMGYTNFQLKRYDVAAAYLDSAQTIARKINDPYTLLDSYAVLSDIYEVQKKYKDALEYYQAYTQLKDSLNEASNVSEIQELELKYQNEKKVAEIELLKSNQQVQDLTLSRQRLLITVIVILLIAGIAIGFLLVNRYRVMSRTKRLLEIEQVRNNLARDLHDDIGSTLSSINILSQVALNEKNGNVQHYLQRIGDQSARIMEDIGDMVWSVNPHNDSIREVVTHMREFASEILESKNIAYHFSEHIPQGIKLTPEQRKNLFLIFKETINNAAKYSGASRVDITLLQADQNLIMRITDNGKGFDLKHIKPGNGLRNQQERAIEIKGVFSVKSVAGEGTMAELQLPIA